VVVGCGSACFSSSSSLTMEDAFVGYWFSEHSPPPLACCLVYLLIVFAIDLCRDLFKNDHDDSPYFVLFFFLWLIHS
jgi:hypothetical protein